MLKDDPFYRTHSVAEAIQLVKFVCNVTKQFPDDERFGLSAQMRRSAVSIPSNIAEGHVRSSKKEFKQFIAIARGSGAELETQAVIAHELGYLTEQSLNDLLTPITSVNKILSSLYGKL